MPLTEKERITQALYDVRAEEWLNHSGGKNRPSFWAAEMERLSIMSIGKKIVEIGAGPATDGKYLIQKGFNVTSTDYSTGMMDLARKLQTNDKLVQADMQETPFKNNSFDGFWASACLLHLEDPAKALKEIRRIVKPEGIGFISVKEGEGIEINEKTGYFFHYFEDNEFQKLLTANNFEILDNGRRTGTPRHDWLTYIVGIIK